MLYVYILRCADDSFYVGVTNNIERRLAEHQGKINPDSYTAQRLPVELVFHCTFQDPREAIVFEKQLKGWSRKKKIALIEGRWDDLPALAARKTPFREG